MKRFILLAALAGSTPAYAQTPATALPDDSLAQPQITMPETNVSRGSVAERALSASAVTEMGMPDLPAVMTFTQLNNQWRRFSSRVIDPNVMRNYGGSVQQYEQILDDLGIGVHFTKGDHLTLGKESYLVAYRVDSGMDPQDLQQEIQQRLEALWGHGEEAELPRPAGKFSPRSTLKLTLLNLRNLGDFKELVTFNAKTDLLSPKDLRGMSNANLKRMGEIIQQYSSYQALPLRDMNALRQLMRNAHEPVSLLRDPASNEMYQGNATLAGKKLDRIGNNKKVYLLHEAAPSSDNTRGVLFADGHVERVPEWKWKQVRAVKLQPPTAQQLRVISSNQLKTLHTVLSYYVRRSRPLPAFKDSQTARNALRRQYGYPQTFFQSPVSNNWYLFNMNLSGVMLKDVSNKSQVVSIYEPEIGSDGKRGALFLDGVVRRIPTALWKTTLAVKPKTKKTETGRMARFSSQGDGVPSVMRN